MPTLPPEEAAGMLIDEASLSGTIDAVSARLAYGEPISATERGDLVAWLLDRQIRSGRGCGMFAPFPGESKSGVRLFTGERLRTRVAVRNVLTLESARVLSALTGEAPEIRSALARTSGAMRRACFAVSHCVIGECAHSSIAYMRDAASERSGSRRKWIEDHLHVIREHREGTGRWKRFPFYYTLLALLEVGTPAANAELEYARPACRRVFERASNGEHTARRKDVLRRALEGSTGFLPVR